MEPLISIIVPVYNAEKYLERCVESLIQQSYRNLEIILVDDGSKDNSLSICEKYCKLDKRVNVIHKNNTGVSDTRNVGIKKSSGIYISFVDSDDFVDVDYIKALYKILSENDVKISALGKKNFKIIDSDIIFSGEKTYDFRKKVDNVCALKMILEEKIINGVSWGKLYSRELLLECMFNTGLEIGEDLDLLFRILQKVDFVAIDTSFRFYNWNDREDSTIKNGYNESWKKEIEFTGNIVDFCIYNNKFKKIQNVSKNRMVRVGLKCIYKCFSEDDLSNAKLIFSLIKKYSISYIFSLDEKMYRKFSIILLNVNVKLGYLFYKKIRGGFNMKVFLKGYLEKNLGDDIFIKILTERYKNVEFTSFSYQKYGVISNNLNIKSKPVWRFPVRVLNKLIREIGLNNYLIPENIYKKKQDIMILIGGSLFCENNNLKYWENTLNLEFYKLNMDYYIIGSNFGPYTDDKYFPLMKKFFSKAKDVCFRDKYSFELFSDLNCVRYAPDIVFSLDTSEIIVKKSKRVVISVVNCERKTGLPINDIFELKIIEIMKYFVERGYLITLMSFCNKEGDSDVIKSIMSNCTGDIVSKTSCYYYDGNIIEALSVIADCEIVFGSRFHANILGLLFDKVVVPIAYSDKTVNVFKDMNFGGTIIEMKDIEKFDVSALILENNADYNISNLVIDSEKQFEALDKILRK